jgi:hypothetical protein
MSNPKTFEEAFRHAKREEYHENLSGSTTSTAACSVDRTTSLEKSVADLTEDVSAMATNYKCLASTRYDNHLSQSNRGGSRQRVNGRGRGRGKQRNSDWNLRAMDGRPICNYCMKVGQIEHSCMEKKNAGN